MLKHADVTEQVIQAYYKVYNQLGYGFLEKVYQNALVLELRKRGLRAEPRWPINVYYEGELVGEYFADVLVSVISGCPSPSMSPLIVTLPADKNDNPWDGGVSTTMVEPFSA